ncbi:MAG: RHS repeat protein [Pyrinomonadaceae bacterium]|nr:RHS repeat protein [Pyrinomonadaceae bacterium]
MSVRAQEAQTAARPDRGTMPNGTYAVSDIENINLQNGNLNITIPLAALPPVAGGKLSWTIKAQYNSKLWNIIRTELVGQANEGYHPYVVDTLQLSELGGWRISDRYQITIRNAREDFDYQIPPPGTVSEADRILLQDYNWYKAVLTTPDGAEHELRPIDYGAYGGSMDFLRGYYSYTPYLNGTMRYYSFDGSFLYAEVTTENNWKVYMPDGTQIIQTTDGIQRIQDNNGNKIKIYSDTDSTQTLLTTHYVDEQTGREIRYVLDTTANNNHGRGKVQYQTVEGDWIDIVINFGATQVQGQLYRVKDWIPYHSLSPCNRYQEVNEEVPVIDEIIFPQTELDKPQRKFTFDYNSDTTESVTTPLVNWTCGSTPESYTRQASKGWGALNKVVTPSGAEIKYSYSQDLMHSLIKADNLAEENITKKELSHDDTTDTWEYSVLWNNASVTNPDGSVILETKYPHLASFGYGYGVAGLVFRSVRPFTRVDRHWINLTFSGAYTDSPGGQVSFNPVVDAEYTTLLDAGNNELKMSAKTFQYDYNGNLLETKEYDWFDPGLVSRDGNGVPTGVPQSAVLLRTVNNSYYNQAGSAASGNVYAKRALGTATPRILNAVQETTTGPADTRFSYDNLAYGTAPTLGNLTKVSSFDNQGDNNVANDRWLDVSTAYDSYGNKTSVTDANGRVTLFEYDNPAYGQPNRVKVDPLNGTGLQITSAIYDQYTGLVTSQTDVNGQVSTISYMNQRLNDIDPFGRPGMVTGPLVNAGNVSQHRRVTTQYWDSQRKVVVASDLNTENDQLLKTSTTSDMLGRVVLTEQTEGGTDYTISARKVYEQMGKITYSSNPTRGSNAATNGWTRTTVDAIGRVTEVATFSGDNQPPATGINDNSTGRVITTYSANSTTVTDQAGKVRRSVVDALGRLIRIDEPDAANNLGTVDAPVQPTNYSYDVLGNLVQVTQGTQTPRVFSYSSISRLASAQNPESGAISYQYDGNGNLTARTDARGVVTAYGYDGLNRLVSRSYSDSTPAVTYTYDTLANRKGMLASVGSTVSTTNYTSYDALGRVTSSNQVTNGETYSFAYSYDLAGNLRTQTYPSGRVIETEYDTAGRISGVKKQNGNYYAGGAPTDTANRIQYGAHGGITALKLGNGLWERTGFNSRLQPVEIKLGTSSVDANEASADRLKLTYSYGTSDNNGNVRSQSITVPTIGTANGFTATQSYSYDQLNRLKTYSETNGLSQTFDYDRWGNRAITAGYVQDQTLTPQSLSAFGTNNRLLNSQYDLAGNVTQDGAGRTFGYDGENKQSSFNNGAATYQYDGDGRRVKKVIGSETTIFVYNAGGQLVAEYTNSSVQQAGGTSYLTADHLGTPRVITGSNVQDELGGIKARHDYLPFGEEITSSVGGRSTQNGYVIDSVRQKFTQKERDAESGLDYFEARYYSSAHGRFTSVDPIAGSQTDPQSLNLYSYVRNNPLSRIDPTGQKDIPAYVATFIKDNLALVLRTSLRLNVSAAGVFAIAALEGSWGRNYAYKNRKDTFGMNGGKPGRGGVYKTLDEGYVAFEGMIQGKFSHVLGIRNGYALIDALVSGGPTGKGFKYNIETDKQGKPIWAPTVKDIIGQNGFEFFDDFLDQMRSGVGIMYASGNGGFGFVSDIETLTNILYSDADDPIRKAVVNVIYNMYRGYVRNIGTLRDPNIQQIHRMFSLPGSSESEAAEAAYEYKVERAFAGY